MDADSRVIQSVLSVSSYLRSSLWLDQHRNLLRSSPAPELNLFILEFRQAGGRGGSGENCDLHCQGNEVGVSSTRSAEGSTHETT